MKKLIFDTLRYAKMLSKGGISHPEIHAESLAVALTHNIYIKDEVDKMIDTTFVKFDKKFDDSLREFRERTHQIEKQTIELKAEISKMFSRYTVATITILGGLMTLFAFIEHLLVR